MLTNELQLTVPKRYTRFKSKNHWCKLSILTFRTGDSCAHCVGRRAFSCDLCHWHIDQSIKSAKTITSEKRSLVIETFCWTLWSRHRRGDAIWNWCAPLPRGPHCRRGQGYPKCWLGNGPGWRSPGNQEPLWQPEDKRQALPAAVQVRQAGHGVKGWEMGQTGWPRGALPLTAPGTQAGLGAKPRTLWMLSKWSNTELHPSEKIPPF